MLQNFFRRNLLHNRRNLSQNLNVIRPQLRKFRRKKFYKRRHLSVEPEDVFGRRGQQEGVVARQVLPGLVHLAITRTAQNTWDVETLKD